MIGQTLSHYKITSKLGEGGMGELYRAEDTTLRREVAIKVLPEQFTQDAERLARFQREAQLLASLNHPNIAAIYGLEKADGVRFLVLELVEGETLAERLARGPLPWRRLWESAARSPRVWKPAHESGISGTVSGGLFLNHPAFLSLSGVPSTITEACAPAL